MCEGLVPEHVPGKRKKGDGDGLADLPLAGGEQPVGGANPSCRRHDGRPTSAGTLRSSGDPADGRTEGVRRGAGAAPASDMASGAGARFPSSEP